MIRLFDQHEWLFGKNNSMIKITNELPQGEVFNIFLNNTLLKKIESEMTGKKEATFFFKSLRLGILGQTLIDESFKDLNGTERIYLESIGLLAELYVYYVRSLYDYLLRFLDGYLDGERPRSFNDFLKQLENDKHVQISDEFRASLINHKISFSELRDIRDSIKEKTSSVYPYVLETGTEKSIRIRVNVYGRDKTDKGVIDKSLYEFIFSYAFGLWYIMMIIYMQGTNKTWETLNEVAQ